MALNKMSRKRCKKLLMAKGYSRNAVNRVFDTMIRARRLYELNQHRNKINKTRLFRIGDYEFLYDRTGNITMRRVGGMT